MKSCPWIGRAAFLALLFGLTHLPPATGQTDSAEHESHHPEKVAGPHAGGASVGASPADSASDLSVAGPARDVGAMGGMQKMMEGMMGGGKSETYPRMMSLPGSTPETRSEVERSAEKSIHEGTVLLREARERLEKAIEAGDHEGATGALQQTRDAIARLESGVSSHRAIREGIAPKDLALRWYKRNLDLAAADRAAPAHGIFGLSWIHYLMMSILVASALMTLWIYLHRARRVSALLERLASGPKGGVPAREFAESAVAPSATAQGVHPDAAPSRSNSWSGLLQVKRIFQETPRVKTFRLADPAGGRLPFNYLPGQFLTLTVAPNGQAIKRSYTIASSPTHRDYCEVTVRHEDRGAVSGYLHERIREGDALRVTAPSGKFTFDGKTGRSIVLIAGGVGVTPMMSVVRYLTDRSWPGDVYLVYGCKADDDVIYREEIEYLARRYPNFHVTLIAERAGPTGWSHRVGRITPGLLTESVPDIASRHVHLCGPAPMMEAVRPMLASLGVPASEIETEVFIGKERPQPLPSPGPQAGAVQDADLRTGPLSVAKATFERSRKTAALPPGRTILEAAEDIGVNIEYSCRVGTCGTCKVKLLAGTVTMDSEEALEPADKALHLILACQAKATSDVSIDA